MTPSIRMVSVPVDELAQEIRRVDGNHSLGAGALAEALLPFLSRFTAAPVREEGGAVWFGVTGAADETEALAVALFDARCPGVRMTDEDLHYYRAAAQRAMRAVEDELETPALATREEAPAEAGDTLHPDAQPFEQYPELALHIERMAMSGVVGSMISWDAFLRELNAALRAQPPAREDAQPVDCYDCATDRPHLTTDACTPTAPEAEKLRVAVEALKPFSMAFRSLSSRWEDHETHWHEATSAISVGDLYRADTALAALQAEQKGGA